jgi:HEAT repeat protein
MKSRFVFSLGASASLLATSIRAPAQPFGSRRSVRPVEVQNEAVQARDASSSLAAHLPMAVADRLLASDSSDDRIRGLERLLGSGQREAIDRVLRAFEAGSNLLHDAHDPDAPNRARLTVVRGLAPYLARDDVRKYYEKELATEPGSGPLSSLVRETAAMALAANGEKRSIETLLAILRLGGSGAELAARALLAHPPKTLEAFASRDGLPAAVSNLLGQLGDLRAVSLLRGALTYEGKPTADEESLGPPRDDDRAHLAAAKALARLGDPSPTSLARTWVTSSIPWLRLGGVSVLLAGGAPDARQKLIPLLSGSTRREALELAAASPSPDLVPALSQLAKGPDDWRLATWTLGSIGGQDAAATLAVLMNDSSRSWEAAFSLARAPGSEARAALEAAQSNARLRRLAARAGTARALTFRDPPSGLTRLMRDLIASRDPADRAAGAFGLAVLRETPVRELVASTDPVIVRSAARASLVLGGDAARACAERLSTERDVTTRAALGIALVFSEAAGVISTDQLADWAEGGQPFAPLATLALGSREDVGTERRLDRLLTSADPVLRAHAALALGQSPLPDAVSRLIGAWRFEADPSVRRAIVISLGQRREPQRTPVLELVRQLDPDEQAREAARLALRGQLPLPTTRLGAGCAGGAAVGGCYVAARSHRPSKAAAPGSLGGQVGRWLDASGLALPLVTDPDGALVVAGVSPGDSSFDLASSPFWYDAHRNDAAEGQP